MPGQVVTVEIIAQPSRHAQPVARVVEVLGNYADPGMEIEIALRKHVLPHVFSRAAEQLCTRLPDTVTEEDRSGRTDLTQLPLVTIDGETCEGLRRRGVLRANPPQLPFDKGGARGAGGFRLVVAIADVSHYVKHGDALDQEARNRGNSVYFPRRVIPMLPEKLSNGLCSLNPKVARLAVVCDMQIAADGDIRVLQVLCRRYSARTRGSPIPRSRRCWRTSRARRRAVTTPCCRTCSTCTGSTGCSRRRASGAARSTSRPSRPR